MTLKTLKILQVTVRPQLESDLPIFFEQQRDPESHRLAAFISRDPDNRAVFDAHWAHIFKDSSIFRRTILADGEVAGHIGSWQFKGELDVGYWIGKEFSGRGVATRALQLFLAEQPVRPLHAGAARDNLASVRVLEKCGFKLLRYERAYAGARKQEIDEARFILT